MEIKKSYYYYYYYFFFLKKKKIEGVAGHLSIAQGLLF